MIFELISVFLYSLDILYKKFYFYKELFSVSCFPELPDLPDLPTIEEIIAFYEDMVERYEAFMIAYHKNYELAARILGRENLEALITVGGIIIWIFIMMWASED